MKIALFETGHFETAYPLIRLFDLPGNSISIYTVKHTYECLLDMLGDDARRFHWFIRNEQESKYAFYARMFRDVSESKFDVLYLNTVSDNHFYFALRLRALKNTRTILTVHDINCLFSMRARFSVKNLVRRMGRKWLRERVQEFNVISETLVPQLRKKAGNKPIHTVPGGIYEEQDVQVAVISSGVMTLVIPGTVDSRRRNYDDVFALAQALSEQSVHAELVLLGEPVNADGRNILAKAHEVDFPGIRISCYNEFVPAPEFSRQMRKAHFVFIPSVVETLGCDDTPEVYGITKSSGNVFDIIRFAKPYIAPLRLVISDSLSGSGIRYSNIAEVALTLRELAINPNSYVTIASRAIENSKQFTRDNVRAKHPSLFTPLH